MAVEFLEHKGVIQALWADHPDGFYAHKGNNLKKK
ncbi:MAG: hypothetical protein ACI9Y1_000112 [Lentisphaeria bacterium]|jgi:hypothetical protein